MSLKQSIRLVWSGRLDVKWTSEKTPSKTTEKNRNFWIKIDIVKLSA